MNSIVHGGMIPGDYSKAPQDGSNRRPEGRVKWTTARRRAFDVLVEQQAEGMTARESNETSAKRGTVYWQSARWLVENDLAYHPSGSTHLALTSNGHEIAKEGAA